ncbi:hypothetical protein Tco_1309710 [Tanacetum coccineum]
MTATNETHFAREAWHKDPRKTGIERITRSLGRIRCNSIIKDWVSDNEEDDVPQAKIEKKTFKPSFAKIEFVKPKQQEKTARKTINHVKQNRQNIHIPRGNQRNWNNLMSQRLGRNFEMFNKACLYVEVLITCR